MKEIRGLTLEQNKKLHCAIGRGYLDTFEQDPRAWRHTFIGSFLWKWPSRTKTLSVMADTFGHEPTWDDFTDDGITDFVEELKSAGINANSIRTLCNELKAVLNANKKKVPSTEFSELLRVKGEASQHVYLTDKEVMKFLAYKPKNDIEKYAHRNFCVQLLTGARSCDAVRLTINNCDYNTNTLSYVPDKTSGIVVTLPVDERRNLRSFLCIKSGGEMRLATYNDAIRKICQNLRLKSLCTVYANGSSVTDEKWKFVSSHTARRSFATNLFLAGLPLEDIASMMGHGRNIETTKRYICAERKITPRVKAYFLPEDCLDTSEEYCTAYNAAITDTLNTLEFMGAAEQGSVLYNSVKGLMK